jgi:hypothetical protein
MGLWSKVVGLFRWQTKTPYEPSANDLYPVLTNLVETSASERFDEAMQRAFGARSEGELVYDLSLPAIRMVPVLRGEDPQVVYWRERDRDARYALKLSSRLFAKVVLDALDNGHRTISPELEREAAIAAANPWKRPRMALLTPRHPVQRRP